MSDMFPCSNCGAPSTTTFAGVPVCSGCKGVVDHLMEKTELEVKKLLGMRTELIRTQLIEARLPRKNP